MLFFACMVAVIVAPWVFAADYLLCDHERQSQFNGRECVQGGASGHQFCESEQPPPPTYESCVPVVCGADEAFVRFKSTSGAEYAVFWVTYGLMYNGGISVRAVLEQHLLDSVGGGWLRTQKAGLACLIKKDFGRCIKKGIYLRYDSDDSRFLPLGPSQFDEMFARGRDQQWKVLDARGGYRDDLVEGEFRVLFSSGGYCCIPGYNLGDILIGTTSLCRQICLEFKMDFVENLKGLARQKLRSLRVASEEQGRTVSVRYVDAVGLVRGVAWDIAGIQDCAERYACDFLHYCVLQGTNLGYVDEHAVRHFAFINKGLCRMIRKTLVSCMKSTNKLSLLRGAALLQKKDAKSIPHMAWTVLPEGVLKCANVPHTWSLTFPGATLEGCPMHDQRFAPQFLFLDERLYPRNYLWALDYEDLLKQMHEQGGDFWYKAFVRSKKMKWDE